MMFEEANINPHPMSARRKACLNQCRIQKCINGGTIFDGGCICERPNQCWFNLGHHLMFLEPTFLFPDVQQHCIELVKEACGQ